MKKFILTLIGMLAVYIGCVIWITWGLKLGAVEKFIICWIACIPIGASCIIANMNDWFDEK